MPFSLAPSKATAVFGQRSSRRTSPVGRLFPQRIGQFMSVTPYTCRADSLHRYHSIMHTRCRTRRSSKNRRSTLSSASLSPVTLSVSIPEVSLPKFSYLHDQSELTQSELPPREELPPSVASPDHAPLTFSEDALVAFLPESPQNFNISPFFFGTTSENGYEYLQPSSSQSSLALAGTSFQHWASTNQGYDPHRWERSENELPAIGSNMYLPFSSNASENGHEDPQATLPQSNVDLTNAAPQHWALTNQGYEPHQWEFYKQLSEQAGYWC